MIEGWIDRSFKAKRKMQTWLYDIDGVLEMIARLLTAVAAGAVLGWEREQHDKPAGLRTHMLVSLGAAVFMVAAIQLSQSTTEEHPAIRLDPTRALAGIIGGVGFLGAGTIIEARGSVRGITTAASIWVAAAIGTCSGMGLYRLTLVACALSVVVLWLLGVFEHCVLRTKKPADAESGD